MEKTLKKKILTIGYIAHIIHNALESAMMETIPVDISNICYKICHHFDIYTISVSKLKEFCEFFGIQYQQVLQHGQTLRVSLLPVEECILRLFDALRSYFLSDADSWITLKKLFEEEESELWFLFNLAQLKLFSDTLIKIQAEDITAIEVAA